MPKLCFRCPVTGKITPTALDITFPELEMMSVSENTYVGCDCLERQHRLGDIVAWLESPLADEVVTSAPPRDDLSAA